MPLSGYYPDNHIRMETLAMPMIDLGMTPNYARATFHLNFVTKLAEMGAVPQLGSLMIDFIISRFECRKFARCKFAANLH